MDSKNKEIVDDENTINGRIIDGAIKYDDRIVNWSKVSADFMSKIKDTYIAYKINAFIFEKCAGKPSLSLDDVSDLILSIANYYDSKIDFYQKNTAMLNKMNMMKQAQASANPNQMPFNPMMGMGMMSDMMMGMDQNAMMGMNPMMCDAIETLNSLAMTSKEISSINKDISSKNLKDMLNVITEDKTNKETK